MRSNEPTDAAKRSIVEHHISGFSESERLLFDALVALCQRLLRVYFQSVIQAHPHQPVEVVKTVESYLSRPAKDWDARKNQVLFRLVFDAICRFSTYDEAAASLGMTVRTLLNQRQAFVDAFCRDEQEKTEMNAALWACRGICRTRPTSS